MSEVFSPVGNSVLVQATFVGSGVYASGNIALPTLDDNRVVRIVQQIGSFGANIAFGNSSVIATSTSTEIAASGEAFIKVPVGATYIAIVNGQDNASALVQAVSMKTNIFSPTGDTVTFAFNTGSTNAALPALSVNRTVRIMANYPCFVAFGNSSVAADSTDMPIVGSGGTVPAELFVVPAGATYIAAHAGAGGFIHITAGY